MNIHDEYLRCSECGHNEFRTQELFTFGRNTPDRENMVTQLPWLERRIVYVCNKCGHQLDK